MRTAIAFLGLALWLGSVHAGQRTSTNRNGSPTLGFTRIKGASSVLDMDAYGEELDLEKKLPGNEQVHDRRAVHEASLEGEFLEGFRDSKVCHDITFYMKGDKAPDFQLNISVLGHDIHPNHEKWTWMLFHRGPSNSGDVRAQGSVSNLSDALAGMGNQSSGKLTARDVCQTVWDDVYPNHFKKPGGKIE
jgi:hypothetical protein